MYLPAPFAESRPEVLRPFVTEHPFATLVTTGDDGTPFASHLPLLLDGGRGEQGWLLGHLAKGNEQVGHLAAGRRALAVFHGPHAYVSPRWYATAPAVPTWNYSAVHVYGAARRVDDPDEVRDLLGRTVRAFEPADAPWAVEGLPALYLASMTAGIVAFVIEVDRWEGKFKLSQNRSAADRAGVVSHLTVGTAMDKAVAQAMSEREPRA